MVGQWGKMTGSFIFRRNQSLFHISLLLTDKTMPGGLQSISYPWHVESHTREPQSAFEAEEFAVRQIPGTENTVTRNAKGRSGIFGLSRNKPTFIRWTWTRHLTREYTKAMRERSGLPTNAVDKGHKEVLISTRKRMKSMCEFWPCMLLTLWPICSSLNLTQMY